jgi:hypothetical protein
MRKRTSLCELITYESPVENYALPIPEVSIAMAARQGSLDSWDRGFESHSRHECLCVFILCGVAALRRADPP